MISIIILGLLTLVLAFLQVTTMAWAARAVGSPRGNVRFALLASMLLIVLGFIGLVVTLKATPPPVMGDLAHRYDDPLDQEKERKLKIAEVQLAVGAVELLLTFVVLHSVFRLSVGRTFAPFGMVLGVGLLSIVADVVIVRPHLCGAFVIPTGSMSPTLDPQDRILANMVSKPRRFDLVLYHAPTRDKPIYAKRLIALPGERLRFDGGNLYINDQQVQPPAIIAGKCRATVDVTPHDRDLYRDGQTIQLGADEYFFLGDHTEVSIDSRMQGPSSRSVIVGVVDAIYWPLSKMRIIR